MEHITIIFSNAGDTDSESLRTLWQGLNVPSTIVEIKREDSQYEQKVNEAIAAESDTLILCGHGSPSGLLHPSFCGYLIHRNNFSLIHARRLICIWCYASIFGQAYSLNGFYSTMFISNINEAHDNGCYETSSESIIRSNKTCYQRIKNLIEEDIIPMKEWPELLIEQSNPNDEIDVFNYNGLTIV